MSDLQAQLRVFTGTEQYYYNRMYPFVQYTDGVKFFMENAGGGARWLMDLLVTDPKVRKQASEFAAIRLLVENNSALLTVNDGNDGPNVMERKIEYTDCPNGEYRFYWTGGVWMVNWEY